MDSQEMLDLTQDLLKQLKVSRGTSDLVPNCLRAKDFFEIYVKEYAIRTKHEEMLQVIENALLLLENTIKEQPSSTISIDITGQIVRI